MRVVVYYQSGLVDVFDSTNFTNVEPYRGESRSIMTEFSLRLDLLDKEGLVVDLFTYDSDTEADDGPKARVENVMVPYALRRPGHRIRLVSPAEIEDIAKITLDGEMMMWRQGTELVNAVKFANQELLCFSNAVTVSINQRALSIFHYLTKANPDMDEETVAEMMGYTMPALQSIMIDETAQDMEDEEDDD